MLRRFVGTLVLLTAALLLAQCELAPGSPPVGTPSPTLSATALPSPFPLNPSPTITSSPPPTHRPTATLVPTFTPAPTRTPRPTPVPIPTVDFEALVVETTNRYRQQHGCSPVSIDPQLTVAAQRHAEDMALHDFFSHVSPDGSTLANRVDAVGYRYRLVGENIAAGFSSAVDVVDNWMASEEHRHNILNCEFEAIGVGYVFVRDDPGNETWQHYWVQVFGTGLE